MSPCWHGLLAVAVMAVALWSASANLEENQDLAESQFQPKEVLKALSDAQHSMLADLEEYKNSTKGARGGGSSAETMTTSRCECIRNRMATVVFDWLSPPDGWSQPGGVGAWAASVGFSVFRPSEMFWNTLLLL